MVALTRINRAGRAPIALLCAGIISIAIADSAFAYLTAASNYTGAALDGGWFVGYLLVALASLRAQQVAAADEDHRLRGPLRIAAPYTAIALAVGTGVLVVVISGPLDVAAVRIGAVVAAFALISQLLVLRENHALLRQSRANEHALLESERSLRQVIANAPVALFSIDAGGTLTLATGYALRNFGERAQHLTGRNVREVLAAAPEFLAAVEAALEGSRGSSSRASSTVTSTSGSCRFSKTAGWSRSAVWRSTSASGGRRSRLARRARPSPASWRR